MTLVNLISSILNLKRNKKIISTLRKLYDKITENEYEDLPSTTLLITSQIVNPSHKNSKAFCDSIDNNHNKIATYLLHNTTIDPATENNYPICKASLNGNYYLVSLLLKDKRVDPSAQNNFAINIAVSKGFRSIVELLMKDSRINVCHEDSRIIKIAAEKNRCSILEMLLKETNADPSTEDNFALRKAVQMRHIGISSILLRDRRVDPTSDNNYVIRCAAHYRYPRLLDIIIKHPKVDPFANDNFILKQCSINNMYKTVGILIKHEKSGIEQNHVLYAESAMKYKKIEALLMILNDPRITTEHVNNILIKSFSVYTKQFILTTLSHQKADLKFDNYRVIKQIISLKYLSSLATLFRHEKFDADCIQATLLTIIDNDCKTSIIKLLKYVNCDFIFTTDRYLKYCVYQDSQRIISRLLETERCRQLELNSMFTYAIFQNRYYVTKMLLKVPIIDISEDDYMIVEYAISKDYSDIVRVILENKKISHIQIKSFIEYAVSCKSCKTEEEIKEFLKLKHCY